MHKRDEREKGRNGAGEVFGCIPHGGGDKPYHIDRIIRDRLLGPQIVFGLGVAGFRYGVSRKFIYETPWIP